MTTFNTVWNANFKPCTDKYPMIFTELAWDPSSTYGLIQGKTAGFGANAKNAFDTAGNISWVVGMTGDALGNLNSGLANATYPTVPGGQSGFYRISPVNAPSSCLDVNGLSTANGATVQLWSYLSGWNQEWTFLTP